MTASFTPIIHPWNQELWQTLTLEPERANHALLFCGSRGLGKKHLATALAQFVISGQQLQSEKLFAAGSHPDLHVVMPEVELTDDLISQFAQRYIETHSGKPKRVITIEQIRRLTGALNTHPHISSHRVILILNAETMNHNAANALLKSLEEPPANTLFVVVTDEVSKLAKTIRSRCSLVHFRPPNRDSARAWLELQSVIPAPEIETFLSMSNDHPLEAIRLFESNYLDSLKTIFTDVNGLWTRRSEVTQVAKGWKDINGLEVVEILQKLTTDLLRTRLSPDPKTVFFPVQKSWLSASSAKLSKRRLQLLIDELNYAKQMLATTVDELLVLESVANKVRLLPS